MVIGVGAAAVAGAVGGVVNVALTPAIAATTFITSYYFGYGMIFGEREMYQEDWPRIKKEIDDGVPFEQIFEKYISKNTTVVQAMAKQIFDSTTIFMKQTLDNIISDFLQDVDNFLSGNSDNAIKKETTFIKENIPSTKPLTSEELSKIPKTRITQPIKPTSLPRRPVIKITLNKDKSPWKLAIKKFTDLILKLLRMDGVTYYRTYIKTPFLTNDTNGRRRMSLISNTHRKKQITQVNLQQLAFLKKYPSKGTNYT